MLFYRLREARTTPDGRPIAPPCHTCISICIQILHVSICMYVCMYVQIQVTGMGYIDRHTRMYVYSIILERFPKFHTWARPPASSHKVLYPGPRVQPPSSLPEKKEEEKSSEDPPCRPRNEHIGKKRRREEKKILHK